MSTIEEFKDGKADDETVNIVVLCDGTLNRPTIETNVYKLHMLLLSEVNEVKTRDISDLETWFKELKKRNREYRETYVIPNDAFRHNDHYYEAGVGERINLIDTVTADDIDYKIKSAYRHIVQRYNDDQNKSKPKEIWLFGFSRGAYTARCVAGMITNCGILKYDSVELMNRAYEIYRSRNPNHSPKGLESRTFRDSFSHSDVKIKFLGLWDTVGAHGLPSLTIGKGFEYLKLYDQNVSKQVIHAYQVLAIHERSAFFEPCRIFRRCARCEELLRICEECERTKLEEVWFPGDHLEIGGGIFSVNREISDESLYWMLQRILRTGGLLSKEPLEGGELDQRLAELKERLVTIKKIPKPLSTSLKQRALPLFPFFIIKRASAAMPLMRRDRTIPIRRDEKGMLTFDQLYNGGDWKFEKFRSIRDIKVHEHKKPDSLVRFYTLMEDILIEELKTSGGVNGGGMKTEYQRNMEVAVKKMHYEKGDDDETNKHVSRNIEDGKIEKIERINSVISNIKSFDARTISKFNFDRIIHRYQCNETGCTKCNLYTNHY